MTKIVFKYSFSEGTVLSEPKTNLSLEFNALDLRLIDFKTYFVVAVKYTTKKRLIEDAGILGAEVTPEISAVLELLRDERDKSKKLELALSKATHQCEVLGTKLKNCRCDEENGRRPGLKLLAGLEQRNINRKSGGERYTKEEISFSIGIYKRSPECYRFLMNFIKLPSEHTVRRSWVSHLKSGINVWRFKKNR